MRRTKSIKVIPASLEARGAGRVDYKATGGYGVKRR